MVLCMVGTGMLWVGWYGFNAGSALAADGIAITAFIIYLRFAQAVRPHATTDGATRFASSMRVRGASNRIWLDAVIAAFVALMFAVPLITYAEMPLRIPIHWDLTGTPDGWMAIPSLST